MRIAIATLAIAAVGCVQPVPQPEPSQVRVVGAPTGIVQFAARELTGLGFEITTSDAAGGVLTAKRVRGPKGNVEYLKCNWASNSIAETNATTTLTITFSARAVADSSDVRIGSTAHAAFGGVLGMPDSDDSCASNQVVESRLVAALKSAQGIR